MPAIDPAKGPVIDRRGFLQLGLSGSLALGAAGFAATLTGCSGRVQTAQGLAFLREADVVLLRALFPALLAGALPAAAAARDELLMQTLRNFDAMCARFEPPAQKLLLQLFDLLNSGLTRRLATGVAQPWSQVGAAEAETFLARWAGSSVELFNAGYKALAKITAVSYFALPATWPQSGYPGPLAPVYRVANS